MPKQVEAVIRRSAEKKGYSGRRADAYVYGTLNNMGAMHGNKETAKGERMEKKYVRDHGKKRRGKGKLVKLSSVLKHA
jgi:hypothetical protein